MFKSFGKKIANGFPSNTFTAFGNYIPPDPYVWLDANNPLNTNARWFDKSANDWLCVQNTAINQPFLTSGVVNGQNAYFFDGVNDFMELLFPADIGTRVAIFLVWKTTKISNSAPLAVNSVLNKGLYYRTSVVTLEFASTTGFFPTTAASSFVLHTLTYDSSRENGVGRFAGPKGYVFDRVLIGRLPSNESFWHKGYVAEIIVYNRDLNSFEMSSVENYLNLKYALY
jgi:hypothetical protein